MIATKFIDYQSGPPENLFLNERQLLVNEDHYLMKVKAVGINRAETLHRMGKYPIKSEVQKNIGLEAAGEIIDPNTKEKIFDGIALLSGGSYAQWAIIPKTHVMPLPPGFTYQQGAAIPEAWITAYQLIRIAELKKNEKVVIYAAASGVGTAAIQICNLLGIIPYGVVSGAEKGKLCEKYGVKKVVYYKENENWDKQLIQASGSNFEAVLDCVCASFIGVDGRWVLYGGLSGTEAPMNLGLLLGKRIKLTSTTLKTRSKEYKDELISSFKQNILPEFETKKLQVVIDDIIESDWSSAQPFIMAHKKMESNLNSGKIIISYK